MPIEKNQSRAYVHACYDLSIPREPFQMGYKKGQENYYRFVFRETLNAKADTFFFKDKIKEIFVSKIPNYPVLRIDKELNDRLIDFANTVNGFPTSFNDNFWRMLYFSTVTITTLGFGDIVPISNVARILISLEAIIGVITIGLFLNALAKRIK
jgi:Ion channel